MRQIKFRVWDKDIKDWILFDGHDINVIAKTGYEFHYRNIEWVQFTGTTDKNGKEIYEGDILELGEPKVLRSSLNDEVTYMPIGGSGSLLKVYFENGCFRTKEGVLEDILSWHNSFVKGNLYENPELIE